MKTWLVCSVLMFTFGLGCVVSQLLVPPAYAAAGAQRWENICEYDDNLDDINDYVKRMGAEGWELAGAGLGQTFFVCFKRPLGQRLNLPSTGRSQSRVASDAPAVESTRRRLFRAPARWRSDRAVEQSGVDGLERNIRYKRLDDRKNPDYAELEIKDELEAGPGDLVCIKKGGIHAVRNDSDKVTLSLHTYGTHINHTIRSQFDFEARTAREFKVDIKQLGNDCVPFSTYETWYSTTY